MCADHRGLGIQVEHPAHTGNHRHQRRQQRLRDIDDEVTLGRGVRDDHSSAVAGDLDGVLVPWTDASKSLQQRLPRERRPV